METVPTTPPPLPVSRTSASYSFPIAEVSERVRALNSDQLLRFVDEMSFQPKKGTTLVRPYPDIRKRFCEINLQLNLLGVVAPRFRSLRGPRPIHGGTFDETDKLLSNDRQVIDLHWLHSTKAKVNFKERRWTGLMSGAAFDFSLATAFVTTVGKTVDKIEAMNLTPPLQRQLAQLQDKDLADRWRRTKQTVLHRLRPSLEEAASTDRRLGPVIEEWIRIWECSELLGNDLDPRRLAAIARVAGIRTSDASNIWKKLEKARAYL